MSSIAFGPLFVFACGAAAIKQTIPLPAANPQPVWSIHDGRKCIDATDGVPANCDARPSASDIAAAMVGGGVNMLQIPVFHIKLPAASESTFVVHRHSWMDGPFGCNVDPATGQLNETIYCAPLVPYLASVVAHPGIHGLWVRLMEDMPAADLARLVRTVRAAVGDVNVMYEVTMILDIPAKSHDMAPSVSRELDVFCDAYRATIGELPLYTGAGVHGSLTLAMCPGFDAASPVCQCDPNQLLLAVGGGISADSDGNPRTVGKVFPFDFGSGGVDKYLTHSGAARAGLDFLVDGMLFGYPSQVGDFQRILEVVAADPALRVAVRSDRFNVASRNTTADPTAPPSVAVRTTTASASYVLAAVATTPAPFDSSAQAFSVCGAAMLSALLLLW